MSDPDLKALADELHRKSNENQRRAEELLERHGASLDTRSAANKRLLLFMEHVLPPDSLERLEFEIAWQDEIAESLEEAFRTVIQARKESGEEVSPLDRLTLPPSARAARRRDNGS